MSKKISDYNGKIDQSGYIPANAVSSLYADLNLGFRLLEGTRDIRPVTDIDAIKNSIRHLILTGRGERPFHPELGSGITELLFENVDSFTAAVLRDEITGVVRLHEKRVDNVDVEIFDDGDRNAFYVTIKFSIRQTDIPTEVSFYLDRIR